MGLALSIAEVDDLCRSSGKKRLAKGSILSRPSALEGRQIGAEDIMRKDVIVLGAGIVGVSVAVHLQQRGRSVLLVDRRGPGEETSYGNAGLIQREGVYPYGFPHDFGALLRYATNRTIDAHYHLAALPKLAPFLFRYWMHSRPEEHRAIARLYAPLIEHSVIEHAALAEAAGATDLIRPTGWMKVFRSQKVLDAQLLDVEATKRDFGVNFEAFDGAGARGTRASPDGQFHRRHPLDRPGVRSTIPYQLTMRLRAPVREARRRTGRRAMRARSKRSPTAGASRPKAGRSRPATWSWRSGPGPTLSPRGLGYRLPLAVKRGYHMHYKPDGNAVLNRPTLDFERGYFLAPDVEGRPPYDGRRIRQPRCAEDAGAARSAPSRSPSRSSRSASASIPSRGWACGPARPT